MLDHVGLNVRDHEVSKTFFEQALAPLGYRVVMAVEGFPACGFGTTDKPEFWLVQREPFGTGTHVAFRCDVRAAVDQFHQAAVAAGGTDNGPPDVRTHYHPSYYAAFVLDPDGNNIEAVCHAPA